jgi:hypothetical protein
MRHGGAGARRPALPRRAAGLPPSIPEIGLGLSREWLGWGRLLIAAPSVATRGARCFVRTRCCAPDPLLVGRSLDARETKRGLI